MSLADEPNVRAAILEDASELARLFTLLDHPATPGEVATRWEGWSARGNSALVVARADGTLAGVATLHLTETLHKSTPVGRITLLVVDTPERGKGLGRVLVRAAEAVLTRSGCAAVELTSNMRHAGAHLFYAHIGYKHTSLRFEKVF